MRGDCSMRFLGARIRRLVGFDLFMIEGDYWGFADVCF